MSVPESFKADLQGHFDDFMRILATPDGDWTVKGFIDVFQNIYTISVDTKVISKIIELMLFPTLCEFARIHNYKMVLCEHQNHYPDITFITEDESKIAVDVKSTYRTSATTVNGFTLGAFTGYFRERDSNKNVTFPYSQYSAHLVLGVIYSRLESEDDENRVYHLNQLASISSVVHDFSFLIQDKWRIATDRPGSGNTKNIGSVQDISALTEGRGVFAEHGESVFDDYWMNYLTKDMALAIESPAPYKNLSEYLRWKAR